MIQKLGDKKNPKKNQQANHLLGSVEAMEWLEIFQY